MLFAGELDAAGQTLSWAGVIGALITLIGASFTAWLTYRSNRDRMEFDRRVSELEASVDHAKEAEKRAIASEEKCRSELREVRLELKNVTDYLIKKGMPPPT